VQLSSSPQNLSYATASTKPPLPAPPPGYFAPCFVGVVTAVAGGALFAGLLALVLPPHMLKLLPAMVMPYGQLLKDVVFEDHFYTGKAAEAVAAVGQALIYGILFGLAFRRSRALRFVLCVVAIHWLAFWAWYLLK
jgi:hypothetical protein